MTVSLEKTPLLIRFEGQVILDANSRTLYVRLWSQLEMMVKQRVIPGHGS